MPHCETGLFALVHWVSQLRYAPLVSRKHTQKAEKHNANGGHAEQTLGAWISQFADPRAYTALPWTPRVRLSHRSQATDALVVKRGRRRPGLYTPAQPFVGRNTAQL